MTKPGETVRLQGRVRGIGLDDGQAVIEHVTVEAEGRSLSQLSTRLEFELIDASGEAVRVEPIGQVEVAAEDAVSSGAWDELQQAYPTFPDDFTAPFTAVKLSSRTIRTGDEVAVYGQTLDVAFDEAAGPRDAPSTRPGRVQAEIVAGGEHPHRQLDTVLALCDERSRQQAAAKEQAQRERITDPGHPGFRQPWTHWIFPAVLAAGAVPLLLFAGTSRALGALALALAVLSCPRSPVHQFRQGGTAKPNSSEHWRILLLALGLAFMLTVGMLAVAGKLNPLVPPIGASATLLLLLVLDRLLDHGTYRHIAQILGAPRLDINEPTGWCGGEGVVRDRTPVTVAGEDAALGSVAHYQKSGKETKLTKEEYLNVQGFQIEQGKLTIEVDPCQALWASYVVHTPKSPVFGFTIETLIPTGGRIAWVGLLDRDADGTLRLNHEGTRPALLLATSAKGQPLAVLKRVTNQHWVSLALQAVGLLCSLALLGLAL